MMDLDFRESIEAEVRRMSVSDLIEREQASGEAFGPWHRHYLNERAPASVRKHLSLAGRGFWNGRQYFTSTDSNDPNPSSFTGITNVTELNFCNVTAGAAQYCGIAANDPRAGKVYKLTAGGIIGNTATPTVIFTPRWGQSDTSTSNTTLGVSPTITTVASLSAHPLYAEFKLVFRSIGLGATTGTATGNGFVVFGNASATGTVAVMGSTVPTNLATNVAAGLQLSLTWGTNNASNTMTCQWVHLQSET